jgi:hypothetical protein
MIRAILGEMADRLDENLPAGLYVAISVEPERVRQRLRGARRPFVDPASPSLPSLEQVDETAAFLVRQLSYTSMSTGALASVVGLASVPPEAVANAVVALRLAQRLAVVYGFDPATDRGQIAVWRALAAGLEFELPGEGPLQVRIRDLPNVIRPSVQSAGLELTRSVLVQSVWLLLRRITRLMPIVSPGISAISARRRVRDMGGRMQQALRRLAEMPADPLRGMADAVELG